MMLPAPLSSAGEGGSGMFSRRDRLGREGAPPATAPEATGRGVCGACGELVGGAGDCVSPVSRLSPICESSCVESRSVDVLQSDPAGDIGLPDPGGFARSTVVP